MQRRQQSAAPGTPNVVRSALVCYLLRPTPKRLSGDVNPSPRKFRRGSRGENFPYKRVFRESYNP